MNTELLKSKLLEAAFNGSLTHADTSKWEHVKLGDIAKFKYGYTDKAKESGSARFVRITDILSNGRLDSDNAKYVDITADSSDFLLKKGDLLMARTGATFGKTLLFNEDYPAIYASFLIKIALIPEISPEYYWYFTQSPQYWNQANTFVNGGAQPQFNTGAVSKISFAYPSIAEQKQIVSALEEGFAAIDAIAEAKENLSSTAEMLRSKILKAAFDGSLTGDNTSKWEYKQLGKIGEIITGSTPSKAHKEYYGEDYPFYKPSDLGAGVNVETAEDSLSELGYTQARHLPAYSVLVTCIASIGKTGLIRREGSCNQQINAIVPNNSCNCFYLYYLMISPVVQEKLRYMSRSTTVAILNKSTFATLEIPVPPLAEQKRIVAKIEELFAEIDKLTK